MLAIIIHKIPANNLQRIYKNISFRKTENHKHSVQKKVARKRRDSDDIRQNNMFAFMEEQRLNRYMS